MSSFNLKLELFNVLVGIYDNNLLDNYYIKIHLNTNSIWHKKNYLDYEEYKLKLISKLSLKDNRYNRLIINLKLNNFPIVMDIRVDFDYREIYFGFKDYLNNYYMINYIKIPKKLDLNILQYKVLKHINILIKKMDKLKSNVENSSHKIGLDLFNICNLSNKLRYLYDKINFNNYDSFDIIISEPYLRYLKTLNEFVETKLLKISNLNTSNLIAKSFTVNNFSFLTLNFFKLNKFSSNTMYYDLTNLTIIEINPKFNKNLKINSYNVKLTLQYSSKSFNIQNLSQLETILINENLCV